MKNFKSIIIILFAALLLTLTSCDSSSSGGSSTAVTGTGGGVNANGITSDLKTITGTVDGWATYTPPAKDSSSTYYVVAVIEGDSDYSYECSDKALIGADGSFELTLTVPEVSALTSIADAFPDMTVSPADLTGLMDYDVTFYIYDGFSYIDELSCENAKSQKVDLTYINKKGTFSGPATFTDDNIEISDGTTIYFSETDNITADCTAYAGWNWLVMTLTSKNEVQTDATHYSGTYNLDLNATTIANLTGFKWIPDSSNESKKSIKSKRF